MSITEETLVWSPTLSPDNKGQATFKTFDTPNATEATALAVTIPDDSDMDLQVFVMARSADDDHFGIDLRGTWSRTNGVVTQLRNLTPFNALAGNPAGWAAALDLSGNDVRVRVTGEARWSIYAVAQAVTKEAVAGAPATPLEIFGANLKGWLGGAYADGVWEDLSATGVDTTQSTPGKRPSASTINGKLALLFDGTDDGLNWGGDREIVSGDMTVFAVVETATIGIQRAILSKLYGGTPFHLGCTFFGTSNKLSFAVNGDADAQFAQSDSALNDGNPHVLVGVREGSSIKLYVDGVLQVDTGTEANPVANTNDFLAIGCAMYAENTTANHWSGKIAQPGVVNRAPANAGELAALHAYLLDWAGI